MVKYKYKKRITVGKNAVELNEDFTVPDYIPDIKKVVYCKYTLKENECYQKDGEVVGDGDVYYELILLCEDNTLNSISFSCGYSIKAVCSGDENSEFEAKLSLENKNVRLVSARKISLRSRVALSVFSNEEFSLFPRNTDGYDVNIEKSEISYPVTVSRDISEKGLITNYDIEIAGNMPEIEKILFTDIKIHPNELRYKDGKILLRGDSYITVVYISENNKTEHFTRILDFSDFVNVGECNIDSVTGKIEVKDIKIMTDRNSFAENRRITVDCTYDVEITCYMQEEVFAVTDMYSTVQELLPEYSENELLKKYTNFNNTLTVNQKLPLQEEAVNVVAGFAVIDNYSVFYDAQRKEITLSGESTVNIVTENEKGEYSAVNAKIPFKYQKDAYEPIENIESQCFADVLCSDVTLSDKEYDVNLEISMNVAVMNKEKIEYLSDFELQESSDTELSALTLYYPNENDTVWSVGKKYKCRCNDIVELNKLNGGDISAQKVILIPKSKMTKVFEKQI